MKTWQDEMRELHIRKRAMQSPPEVETIKKVFERCWSVGLPRRCMECPYCNRGCTRELEMDAMDIIEAQAEMIKELRAVKRQP